MSFAELRQSVLQAHSLSTDRFAEDVTLVDPADAESTARAKITQAQLGELTGTRQIPTQLEQTYDEMEVIKVLVSRDSSWEFGVPTRPQPGSGLRRDASRDADQRLFSFTGEVEFEGDQHAVYFYQRPRRVVQGRQA